MDDFLYSLTIMKLERNVPTLVNIPFRQKYKNTRVIKRKKETNKQT